VENQDIGLTSVTLSRDHER